VHVLIVQQLAWGLQIGNEIARYLHAHGHNVSALVYGTTVKRRIEGDDALPYRHVCFADPLYDAGDETVSLEDIQSIEERYGLRSLWRVVYGDRLLSFSFKDSRHFLARKPVDNDYLLSVCRRTYRAMNELLDQVKPDYVLAPVIGALPNYLLFLECGVRQIPFFTLGTSRFGNSFYVADDLFLGSRRIAARFDELREAPEQSPRYVEACRLYERLKAGDISTRPSYARLVGSRRSAGAVARAARELALFPLRAMRVLVRERSSLAIRNIWIPSNSRWNAVRSLGVSLRERFVPTDMQGRCARAISEVRFPYVFFPLHVEPELSLMVFAPEYANQLELCRRLAMDLPRGTRLLTKEHPNMVSSRPRRFYDDLKGLVNVELIHSSVPIRDIFMSPWCRAIVGVSSTAGFEAAMNGRPVVMLGPVPYSGLPTVRRVGSVEEAIVCIQALARGESDIANADTDRANRAYLAAVLESSFSFDYVERWQSGRGHIDVEALVQAIHLRLAEPGP
jgi:hypothetical protein